MYSKLRLHAAILSQWVFDVILSSIQPSEVQLVNFERRVNNGGPWNPKLALKESRLWIKFEA